MWRMSAWMTGLAASAALAGCGGPKYKMNLVNPPDAAARTNPLQVDVVVAATPEQTAELDKVDLAQWFELPTEKRHRPKPTSYVFAVGEAGAKKLELKTGGNDDHAPPGQAEAQRRLPENFDAIFIFARYPGPKSPAHMLKLTRERLEKVKSIEIEFGKDGIREPKLGK